MSGLASRTSRKLSTSVLSAFWKTQELHHLKETKYVRYFLVSDSPLITEWPKWIGGSSKACNMMYQDFLDRFYKHSLVWRTATLILPKAAELDLKLTVAEEQTQVCSDIRFFLNFQILGEEK